MRLTVITTETLFDGEPEAINLLFENGMERLHVRKPSASREDYRRLIEQISAAFHPRLVVHDYYDLAGLFPLKGIHLNVRNGYASGNGLTVGRSCHSIEEAVAAQDCDYVFLSPVFDSISKAGYSRKFTPETLTAAQRDGLISGRMTALGGVTAERIPEVRQYGFGGAAVIGSLWREFPADGDSTALLERYRRLRIKCDES